MSLDYNQYTVNQSVPVQQPNVKISEVNTKQYQKPKKVAVNEADKYNLNHDYDIYENQVKEHNFFFSKIRKSENPCKFSKLDPSESFSFLTKEKSTLRVMSQFLRIIIKTLFLYTNSLKI